MDEIIATFLAENPEYDRVVWEDDDLTVYFKDSKEPWGPTEFMLGTSTRASLDALAAKLHAAVVER